MTRERLKSVLRLAFIAIRALYNLLGGETGRPGPGNRPDRS